LPAGIPLFQVTLTLLALAVAWRFVLTTRVDGGERWALLTLLALFSWLYLKHPRSLDADGIHYFTYARSLIADGDLDLANDYALLGHPMEAKNVLPIGAPLVWCVLLVPLYLLRSLASVMLGFPTTGADTLRAAGWDQSAAAAPRKLLFQSRTQ